jgi:hypothetical protein
MRREGYSWSNSSGSWKIASGDEQAWSEFVAMVNDLLRKFNKTPEVVEDGGVKVRGPEDDQGVSDALMTWSEELRGAGVGEVGVVSWWSGHKEWWRSSRPENLSAVARELKVLKRWAEANLPEGDMKAGAVKATADAIADLIYKSERMAGWKPNSDRSWSHVGKTDPKVLGREFAPEERWRRVDSGKGLI